MFTRPSSALGRFLSSCPTAWRWASHSSLFGCATIGAWRIHNVSFAPLRVGVASVVENNQLVPSTLSNQGLCAEHLVSGV
ncbi:hypothetical protein B9Q02_10675 [Candidatus Marsarchaeota G1 archaeon BE_D]|uniref:Uncharacterized protein n=1 Tax=Candidatus Marsarchaeota G1 archaeon BE_D TaxID=1978156 RepID=A0A2R6AA79_9ARCH|nr:MAG: hypothetical protein B9Q02_10675 [Candidatus Marsarchaeota G1 archaeon BE_D]